MLEDISFETIKEKFQSNKKFKIATYAIGTILILGIVYFTYLQFVYNPANTKSKDAYWKGLNYAVKDSTDLSIKNLSKVSKKYEGKLGGEVSQFVLGRQLMNKGKFKKAIEKFEGVDLKDSYVSALSIGLIGDCYNELKKYSKAIEYYTKASEKNDGNDFVTPMFLFKAGLCYEELKKFDSASDIYKKLKEEYPDFSNQKSIDKFIARASNTKVK